jgi:hypothetical protein
LSRFQDRIYLKRTQTLSVSGCASLRVKGGRLFLLMVFSSPLFPQVTGDANSDGSVNIVDALLISQYYVGIIDVFPVNVPTSGPTEPPTVTNPPTVSNPPTITNPPTVTGTPMNPPTEPPPTPDPTPTTAPTPDPVVPKGEYVEWQKMIGGSGDVANAIMEAPDRGFLIAGYSYSNNLEGCNLNGFTDCLIMKYSPR